MDFFFFFCGGDGGKVTDNLDNSLVFVFIFSTGFCAS